MRLPTVALAVIAAACAAPPRTSAGEAPARWGAHSIELLDGAGRVLPTFEHRGRTYVLGAAGGRYVLRVRNGSGARVEVVASVDGRDVVDGRPASFEKRGYVVEPYGELRIDGFRLGEASVAAFRFGSVARSYAAQQGDARDVGVVGVAVFAERAPPPVALQHPSPGARGDGAAEAHAGEASGARAEQLRESSPRPRPGGDRVVARPGLGTEFGEERASPIVRVGFERASARPQVILTLRYDDRPGLLALGIDVDRDRWARAGEVRLRETADPFRAERYCEPPPGWRAR